MLKRYEKLDLRLPVVTVRECMECRVIARPAAPALVADSSVATQNAS
ncbi:hypothetical protein ABIC01_005595 [Bradyrhizobium sp. RT4b]